MPSGSRHAGPRWFVVSTYTQAERPVARELHRQGYLPYLPLVAIRRRDRVLRTLIHTVHVPLFSGYVFVQFDAQRDPWRPITNTPGVYRLLADCQGIPQPAAKGAVEALQALDAQRATPHHPGTEWAPGAAVAVSGGVFDQHHAVVLNAGSEMALIAVMMFGQLREVAVDVNCLRVRDE